MTVEDEIKNAEAIIQNLNPSITLKLIKAVDEWEDDWAKVFLNGVETEITFTFSETYICLDLWIANRTATVHTWEGDNWDEAAVQLINLIERAQNGF
jgi:hypothetical protein